MQFNELYSIINEYPHAKGYGEYKLIKKEILYVDYKVELWKDVEMEIKQAYASILLEMNENKYIIIFKDSMENMPYVKESENTFIPILYHPLFLKLCKKKNVDKNRFILDILENKEKWEYVYA